MKFHAEVSLMCDKSNIDSMAFVFFLSDIVIAAVVTMWWYFIRFCVMCWLFQVQYIIAHTT